jgi:osmotically-inducible protein OsmY
MKQQFRILSVALLAAFAGFQIAGCASSPSSRSTGQFVDDGALTAKVKTALAADAGLGTAADVNVTTYRGVVQLSGFVEKEEMARRAVAIAQGVEGVRSVQNDLHVKPSR